MKWVHQRGIIDFDKMTDFSINLTNNAIFADYVTNGTTTTLVVILPENTDIFETVGNFEILSVKVGVDEYYIDSYIN